MTSASTPFVPLLTYSVPTEGPAPGPADRIYPSTAKNRRKQPYSFKRNVSRASGRLIVASVTKAQQADEKTSEFLNDLAPSKYEELQKGLLDSIRKLSLAHTDVGHICDFERGIIQFLPPGPGPVESLTLIKRYPNSNPRELPVIKQFYLDRLADAKQQWTGSMDTLRWTHFATPSKLLIHKRKTDSETPS